MYAFYPLLIKYVDLHRSNWLKNSMIETELLYLCVAEVFNLWVKSHVCVPCLTFIRFQQNISDVITLIGLALLFTGSLGITSWFAGVIMHDCLNVMLENNLC